VSELLKGVRVLDLTTILAGPFAAYQLSLFGADVTKLEIPGTGDLAMIRRWLKSRWVRRSSLRTPVSGP
jgi:crotonobetainyl-CoA:carnitine CoA-transferase CaiB-like acyl-CoA transferase